MTGRRKQRLYVIQKGAHYIGTMNIYTNVKSISAHMPDRSKGSGNTMSGKSASFSYSIIDDLLYNTPLILLFATFMIYRGAPAPIKLAVIRMIVVEKQYKAGSATCSII